MARLLEKLEAALTAAALGEEGESRAARRILAEAGIGEPTPRPRWRPRPAPRGAKAPG
jgi:hypothetical protein